VSESAETTRLRGELSRLEQQLAQLTREPTGREMDEISAAKQRADEVARLYGTTASNHVPGETPVAYRKRLLEQFRPHSPSFASASLDALHPSMLDTVEKQILEEARAKAVDPASHPPGKLTPVQEFDSAGRLCTKFYGDSAAWMAPFMTKPVLCNIVRSPKG